MMKKRSKHLFEFQISQIYQSFIKITNGIDLISISTINDGKKLGKRECFEKEEAFHTPIQLEIPMLHHKKEKNSNEIDRKRIKFHKIMNLHQ